MINIGLFCTTGTMGVHNSCDASLMSPTPTPSPTWTSTWTPTPFETSAYSTAVQDSVTVNLEGVASTQEEGRRFSDGAGIGGVAPGEMGGYFSPSMEMGAGIGGIGSGAYDVLDLIPNPVDKAILREYITLT
ncbi:MAG: hypothetical protein LBJ13_02580, partial [Puniceicoccales bacterium]|nr:hypothetical protein [Puniceicoccales bacterium]